MASDNELDIKGRKINVEGASATMESPVDGASERGRHNI